MRKLKPSAELLAYLDHELEGRQPPARQPSVSPAQRRVMPRAVIVALALAIAALGAGIASLALAQDGGVCREPDAGIACEPEAESFSCCTSGAVVTGDTPPEPPPLATVAIAENAANTPVILGLGGVLLVLLAIGNVFVPPLLRRLKARRDLRRREAQFSIESRRGGRRYNEDRSAAFSIGAFDILVAADGMGGHIGGARAAAIVVEVARGYLTKTLPLAHDTTLVEDFLRAAFFRASEALAEEDAEIGLGTRGVDALRSTLIVAVAGAKTYVVGAQGDGGAWVLRGSGLTMPLMTPAKGGAANIVAASLGPTTEGRVEIATTAREPGDLLVVCSDGVADRIGPEFNDALRAYADEAASAAEIVKPILDELDGRPAVFDDNITLGVLVTP